MTQQKPKLFSKARLKKITCLLVAVSALSQISFSQNKFTISGYVKDSLTGETLIGATLQAGGKGKGVNSNAYGFFSITLDAGDYDVSCSFVGYQSRQMLFAYLPTRHSIFYCHPKLPPAKKWWFMQNAAMRM